MTYKPKYGIFKIPLFKRTSLGFGILLPFSSEVHYIRGYFEIGGDFKYMKETQLAKLKRRLEYPTPEEKEQDRLWVIKNFNKAGRMSKTLFERVLQYIIFYKTLGYEDLLYCKEEIISADEFMDVFNYIKEACPDKQEIGDSFPGLSIGFKYKGVTFIWELIHGQGSHCGIRLNQENELQRNKIKIYKLHDIDSELGFYVNPDRVDDEGRLLK